MKQPYEISRASPLGPKRMNTMTIVMDMEDCAKWENGTLIQDALPYLTPDEREFLMTGILPHEWDELFPNPDCIDTFPEARIE
jgi:hypothetical protein